MVSYLALLLAGSTPSIAVVGGWDDRPTATVAEGFGTQLASIKVAAEKCGFSRTWIWDDETAGSQLWVLASEVQDGRVACLRRWRATARATPIVTWKLKGLRTGPRRGK